MRLVHICRRALGALLVLGALAFVACATRRDVVVSKLRGRGISHVYPITTEQAWTISKTILELEPTEKVDEHKSDGYMLTSDSSSTFTPSTYMGVFIEPDGPAAAKVTFVTRRRTPTQSYATLSESSFHRKFAELLTLIATVGQLPTPDAGAFAETVDAGAESGADGGS
jgi:hypothetical protein